MRTLLLLNVFEPEEIGDRIRRAREKAGLRQEDLADLIGTSTRQVQNYEAGDSKQYSRLKAIAAATDVTVEWLLHGDREEDAADRLAEVERHLEALAATVADLAQGQAELLRLARGEAPPARRRAQPKR